MAVEQVNVPVPGITNGNTYTPTEILNSGVGVRKRGVIVASGQGVVVAGEVVGQKTSDKKYYRYNSAASDGTQTPVGILYKSVDTTSADVNGVVVISGALKNDHISSTTGFATAITGLAAVVKPATNDFILP